MNVGDDSTSSDSCLDKSVQFFVSSNSKLQVTRRDAFHTKILGSISSQLEHFSRQVLKNGGWVDCGGCSNTAVAGRSDLQKENSRLVLLFISILKNSVWVCSWSWKTIKCVIRTWNSPGFWGFYNFHNWKLRTRSGTREHLPSNDGEFFRLETEDLLGQTGRSTLSLPFLFHYPFQLCLRPLSLVETSAAGSDQLRSKKKFIRVIVFFSK